MTDDLVDRLRALDTWVETAHTPIEAADRIEQLERELSISRMAQVVMDNSVEAAEAECRKYEAAWMTAEGKLADAEADNARLREALQVYADPCDATETSPCGYEGNMCCRTARAALAGKADT